MTLYPPISVPRTLENPYVLMSLTSPDSLVIDREVYCRLLTLAKALGWSPQFVYPPIERFGLDLPEHGNFLRPNGWPLRPCPPDDYAYMYAARQVLLQDEVEFLNLKLSQVLLDDERPLRPGVGIVQGNFLSPGKLALATGQIYRVLKMAHPPVASAFTLQIEARLSTAKTTEYHTLARLDGQDIDILRTLVSFLEQHLQIVIYTDCVHEEDEEYDAYGDQPSD